ncbi:hypothetical protein C9J48_24100 [Photobacterium profundum]|uniref:Uncharacterized protein n=1 Tax=Photobacterium profundum 3TCK TaxID=314280 RepID=Q1Z9C7_9GAMM|nr:hypothetical protein [Photobacterium profundum]EAS44831.1 hypothetical protein P3TCK_20145 [Photobacterium profundum 3TCK]PSV59341.1 hypothetical protein C9J48_24100 [Photobacterium profundum]
MMKWILLTALFFCFSLNAKTVDQYIKQYKNLPCSGLVTKIKDIDKKYSMGNKKKKKEYRKQKKSLRILYSDYNCTTKQYR